MNPNEDCMPPTLLDVVRTGGLEGFKREWDDVINLAKSQPIYSTLPPGKFITNLVKAADKDFKTLLHHAAESGKLDIVEFILSHDPMFISVISNEKKVFLDHLHDNGKINDLSTDSIQIIRKSYPKFDAKQPTTWSLQELDSQIQNLIIKDLPADQLKNIIFKNMSSFPDDSMVKSVMMQMVSADTEPNVVKELYLSICDFEQAMKLVIPNPTPSAADKPL